MYRLGADLRPTIDSSRSLRDLCDFDVLDEALILDGALDAKSYKVLLVFQADIVDQPVLDKFTDYQASGGQIILVNNNMVIRNVEDRNWHHSQNVKLVAKGDNSNWLEELASKLRGLTGVDGKLDGVWTTHRGKQVFALNTGTKPATIEIDGKSIDIAPNEIFITPTEQANK